MTSLADAAVRYARRGWPIFPCRPGAKEPLTPNGFKDATTDAATVARWWTDTPDANIGFVPGRAGFLVIDVDGPEGEQAAQHLGLLSEPTRTCITPRGVHLYFRHPGGHIGNAPLAPHLDVRADDGYVLLPPSVHPSGVTYTGEAADALPAPPDLVAKLNGNGKPHAAPPLPERIPKGQRNIMLTSLAGSMRRRGANEAEILAALEVMNGRCDEGPLDADELAGIAHSIARYEPSNPPAAPKIAPAGPERTMHGTDGVTRSRTLREIMEHPENLTPPQPVVPGLAWCGRITLVSAREGYGKSTLFGAAAAVVTTGGLFLGERCLQGPVVWVLIEEALPDLTLRAIRFKSDVDVLHILERPELPLASLMAEVDRWAPTLVIVDTLHRFASAERQAVRSRANDTAKSDAWAPIMTTLDTIARRSNAAVLMSAQAIKATGEYRDSSEIGHGVDVVLNLIRPDKDSPVRRLEWAKARGMTLEHITLELRGDAFLRGGTVEKRLTKGRQKVLDTLEPPMTFSEWAEAAQAVKVPRSSFTRSVKYLMEHGYVGKAPDDTYVEGPKAQIGPIEPREPLSREGSPLTRPCNGRGEPLDLGRERAGGGA